MGSFLLRNMAYLKNRSNRVGYPRRKTYVSYGPKGRARSAVRYSKKSSAKPGQKQLYELAKKAAREVNSVRHIATAQSAPNVVGFHRYDNYRDWKYMLAPVTKLIPLQRPPKASADARWRTSNTVLITGVGVRVEFAHEDPVRVMALVFPSKVRKEPIEIGARTGEFVSQFPHGMDDTRIKLTRLLTAQETGLDCTKDGPFAVISEPREDNSRAPFHLEGGTDSLFDATLSKGGGAPIGMCSWKLGENGAIKTGRTYSQDFAGPEPNGTGPPRLLESKAEMFFKMNKKVEFADVYDNATVFDPDMELLFGIESKVYSPVAPVLAKGQLHPFPSGLLRKLRVKVYYKSMMN